MEVLLSGVIIITVLAALVMVGRAAINNSEYLQQRAQAIYLAQEDLEIIRQIRDTNWIDGENSTEWKSIFYNTSISASAPYLTSSKPLGSNLNTTYQIVFNQGNRCRLNAGGGFSLIDSQDLLKTFPNPVNAVKSINGVNYHNVIKDPESGNSLGNLLPGSSSINGTVVDKTDSALKITAKIDWIFNGKVKNVEVSELLTNWRPNF